MITSLHRAAVAAALFTVAACAGGPVMNETYAAELNRLSEACVARGGILTPTGAPMSGEPEREYACKITGQPSGRLR